MKQETESAVIRFDFAEVNGVRLHYARAGAGKLILFLHGFPEFWYGWRNQLADFGRGFLAVAPDMRGYNLSSKPAAVEDYQLKYLVEDVRALVEHLLHENKQERCLLAGHDWGGVVAWLFAAQYPERVEKLIIINAPHPAIFERELKENPAQQQASQYMELLSSKDAEEMLSANHFFLLDESILKVGVKEGFFTEADRQAYLESWARPGALTGALNYYRAARLGQMQSGGIESQLSAQVPSLHVRVPTLVIWGEKDPYLLTGNLSGLGQFVPKLQLRLMADCAHWVVHQDPSRVNAYIREFIG